MHFDQQDNNSAFCLRQGKSDHPTQRRLRLMSDTDAECYILASSLKPAIERDGFWRGCWYGYVVVDPQGRRLLLENSKLRRAMRRLLEARAFGSLIDLGEQRKREAFDGRMLRAEKLAERRERRDWEGTR